ncbi:54S ribosomal protein L6 [Durotheca rogersii]|uniref:54S ribosomal protein L6 n=1 Tax=Durotheca rogersii TaxID=419775 RepID=UPI00221F59F3|nr:54S ribosomal protein L6 [Durotheca rogersii]KAI5861312.1 54S ribosomal protein L6 [Durotheca rogersii]
MLAPSRARGLERAIATTITLPAFLVPAFQTAAGPRRAFSSSASRCSKLGRTPITVPQGVELSIGELVAKKDPTTFRTDPTRSITIKGPLGELVLSVPDFVSINYDEASRKAQVKVQDPTITKQKAIWGTTWAYVQQYIIGVSEGHTAVLRLVGVGYRASVEERPRLATYPGQKFVCLKLGFTHPVEEPVPEGIKATTPQPTRILIEGTHREKVMSFAADIRRWRRPEPYKGKGIFVNDETIKLKQKKIK